MSKYFLLASLLLVLSGCSWFGPQTSITPTDTGNLAQPAGSDLNVNQPVPVDLSYTDISAPDALTMIKNKPELIIVDVSPHYDQGHLPGAINLYVGDGSLDRAIPNLSRIGQYLVYCHVDSASILGAQKLIDAGFFNVYRLTGNYSGWIALGYPVEIALQPVGQFAGTGLAVRSYYNNQFEHTVSAELPDPAPGKFYEGWLVKTSPQLKFFSTGKMTKAEVPNNEEANMYNLFYTNQDNKAEFNQVVITEETESLGLDNKPETHVLEGEF